ncbi:hypothetical protein OFN54_31825, partial [Escherichia coli]|nr:hypothetical protein [Escherichia coli]
KTAQVLLIRIHWQFDVDSHVIRKRVQQSTEKALTSLTYRLTQLIEGLKYLFGSDQNPMHDSRLVTFKARDLIALQRVFQQID